MLPRLLPILALLPGLLLAQKKDAPKRAPESKPSAKKEEPKKDDALTAKDTAIVAIDKHLALKKFNTKTKDWRTTLALPPKLPFDPKHDYLWHLETSKGAIVIRLLPDVAPVHCSNAIFLTRLGFYDGLTFHRVIPRFMAQGGCANGTGSSTIGYTFDGEFDKKVAHDKPGMVSSANAGPNTDGAQFFITFTPQPSLDGKHTIFGEVISGMDAVEGLEAAGTEAGTPTEKLVIQRAWIQATDKPK